MEAAQTTWPAGDAAAAIAIRAHDWSSAGLPPPSRWPPRLRAAVDLLLAWPSPAVILWGRDGVLLLNDAYLGGAIDAHPRRLGSRASDGSAEQVALANRVLREARASRSLSLRGHPMGAGDAGAPGGARIDVDYAPLRDDGGQPVGAFGVFLPGHASEPGLANGDRFRLLVQSLRDHAIFLIDVAGVITEWTEGAERVKGYAAAEAIGQHLSLFYPPEDRASGEIDRELAEAAARGRAEREGWRVRKGGERLWCNEVVSAIRDQHGQLIGFAKISRDLTEHHRIQEALTAREEHNRLIVENVRDFAVFMADADGRISSWNPGAERIFGYTAADIIGRDSAVLFTPEDRAKGEVENELSTAAAEGRASDDRWQMRKDGSRFWASGVTASMRDAAGALIGFTKVLRDLTGHKLLEEQRERLLEREQAARADAERAMSMKDEFLTVLSHELRTPLAAVVLWAKMLRGGAVGPDDLPKALDAIEQGALAQQRLIEDLLDVSRTISGTLRLELRDADILAVVRNAIDLVRPMAAGKGVALSAQLDDSTGVLVFDADRVQQVVWNLLNNAVKFSDPGGEVRVSVKRAETRVIITVADTGRGIDPDFLPKVFDRFRQADVSTKRSHGGLGLGLAITRQLVELHGGHVRAESAGPGLGATFTVELPTRPPARRSEPTRTPAARAAAMIRPQLAGPTGRAVRVLLVEDDANTREAIRWSLEHWGAEVVVAPSVDDALDNLRAMQEHQPFDVLLTDIGMPGKDGYDLLAEVRAFERERPRARQLPAIAITAHARQADQDRALAAGFARYLAKPFEPEAFIRAVTEVIVAD